MQRKVWISENDVYERRETRTADGVTTIREIDDLGQPKGEWRALAAGELNDYYENDSE
jgi:hypothetical protein